MKKIIATIALGFTAIATHAVTPLSMRSAQISPDGNEIVFCYKGDIYKVSAKGGTATQLTTLETYECNPVWSPDGKQIAFASDRYGNFDVFVMPANGGAARRLTANSAGELPSTFTRTADTSCFPHPSKTLQAAPFPFFLHDGTL